MTFRKDRQDGPEFQVVSGDLLGGLDTKTPAHRMPPSVSPDLLNVVLDRRSVARRPGFVPMTQEIPGVSSIRNPGFRVEARAQRVAGAAQASYITAAGSAHAGHRPVWNDADVRDGITLDFFMVIDDLSARHGGNAAGAADGYLLSVRPIISKGPLRRAIYTANELPGTTVWSTTNRWGLGGSGNCAMPFAVYLFQNSGVWEIRLSFHVWNGAAWVLTTVATNLSTLGGLKTGQKYHVVAGYSISGGTAILRVGTWFDVGTPTYVTATAVVTGTPMSESTTGPIQLFDCPQELIEAPAAPSGARPPGLELPLYLTSVRRFEGAVEDIAIYRGLVPNIATGSLNRTQRIPVTPPAPLLQHWPVESAQPDMIEEKSGLGNHLYFAPSDPVFDKSGGYEGGALVFNGRTAYALCEMSDTNYIDGDPLDGRGGRPVWRTAIYTATPLTQIEGLWARNVRKGVAHGLEVVFWPESIEPNQEQVVVEAHNAMRVVVLPDGRIRGYTRSSASPVPAYVSAGTSANPVVPGSRYHVIVFRLDATTAQLWVNGTLEEQVVVSAPADDFQCPVGGLTVGAGAFLVRTTTHASGLPIKGTITSDLVETDARGFFFGRVEGLRAIVGSIPYSSTVGAAGIATLSRPFSIDDYRLPFRRLLQKGVDPKWFRQSNLLDSDPDDTVPKIGIGHGLFLPQYASGTRIPFRISAETDEDHLIVENDLDDQQGFQEQVIAQVGDIWRAVCAYDFDVPVAEGGYQGGHDRSVEYDLNFLGRQVHIHRFYKDCSIGLGGPVQLRCIESDVNYGNQELNRNANSAEETKSPRQLAPQWSKAIVAPRLDDNSIVLLKPWKDELSGEQFTIAACRRSLYWLKPKLRQQSPWGDSTLSTWFSGDLGDKVRGTHSLAGGSWTTDQSVVDLWVYPHRLDGDRIVVMRGDRIDDSVQYAVLLRDGQLWVMGQIVGGDLWAWSQGAVATTPTRNLATVSVKLNAWNHIAVSIGAGTVAAWINGTRVPMADAAILVTSGVPITTGSYPACSDVWLGGVSADQWDTKFPSAGGVSTYAIKLRPWCGLMRHARECSSIAHLPFTLTANGVPPKAAEPAPVNSRWQDDLDGTGAFTNSSTEFVPIRADLDDMGSMPADAVVFRQRMVVVHPKIRPQRISFQGFDKNQQFVSHRLGVEAPGDQAAHYRSAIASSSAGSRPNIFALNDVLALYVSFVTATHDSEESPLAYVMTHKVTTPASNMHFTGIPRSPDPQVTSRRIYLSVNNALPVYVGELDDAESSSFEVMTAVGFGLTVPSPVFQLPAPAAARVAVGAGSLVLARTEDNPNQFAISGASPGLFPLANRVAIDSQDGQGLVGLASHLNNVFLFKRNGTWAITGGGVRAVNTSAGCGGGTTIYDNQVFGVGDRGVWAFNGSALAYVSDPLERAFEDVDVSEDGLLAQQGAFFYPSSQWWLSVRRRGERFNRDVYVLHTAAGASAAWTKATLPNHVAVGVLADPSTDRPILAVGTSCGKVLALTPGAVVDGVLNSSTLAGGGGVTGRVISPSTPITAGNLRGAEVVFFDPTGAELSRSRVVANTATTFEVEAAPGGPDVSFSVGAFPAWWSSPWLGPQQMGSFIHVSEVDLDFEPNAGNLQLDIATAINTPQRIAASERAWSSDLLAQVRVADMTVGFRDQPLPASERRRGRYARIRIGTHPAPTGLPASFAVTSYALRASSEGTRGAPT